MGKKSFLLILLACFIFIACKPVNYEIFIDPEVYNAAEKAGVWKNKVSLKKYKEGAFQIYEDDSFRLIVIPAYENEINSNKCIAKIYQEKINGLPSTQFTQTEVKEIKREPLFPCIPFKEDSPTSVGIENLLFLDSSEEIKIFPLDNIPEGYIALPVEKNGELLFVDNENYPLYESTLLFCEITKKNLKTRKSTEEQLNLLSRQVNEWFNKELVPVLTIEKKDISLVFIASVGDMMISRGVEDVLIRSKNPKSIFTDTMPILSSSDVMIGNLEGVVTSRSENAVKTYTFKFKKKALPYLKQAGFTYLMLTNNHSFDYGESGFLDTLEALKEYNFATSGVGRTKKEAEQFYRETVHGSNISIISCGAYPIERSGFNGEKTATATDTRAGILWQSEQLLEKVKQEKQTGSIVIVNVHGGAEYVFSPILAQKEFYTKLCDAGADVVFGSHPHVLQPVEKYKKSLIVWSLGNFVFPGMDEMPGGEDSMIIRTGFVNGRFVYYNKYPAIIHGVTVSLRK